MILTLVPEDVFGWDVPHTKYEPRNLNSLEVGG